MIPVFTRVALLLKGLMEDKINVGESRQNLTFYISKATLDIIGLVGEKIIRFFLQCSYFTLHNSYVLPLF
jgi:hypothetical protein